MTDDRPDSDLVLDIFINGRWVHTVTVDRATQDARPGAGEFEGSGDQPDYDCWFRADLPRRQSLRVAIDLGHHPVHVRAAAGPGAPSGGSDAPDPATPRPSESCVLVTTYTYYRDPDSQDEPPPGPHVVG